MTVTRRRVSSEIPSPSASRFDPIAVVEDGRRATMGLRFFATLSMAARSFRMAAWSAPFGSLPLAISRSKKARSHAFFFTAVRTGIQSLARSFALPEAALRVGGLPPAGSSSCAVAFGDARTGPDGRWRLRRASRSRRPATDGRRSPRAGRGGAPGPRPRRRPGGILVRRKARHDHGDAPRAVRPGARRA